MAPPLQNHIVGDIISPGHVNDIKSYIEDGTYRVNTSALCINGVSSTIAIINTTGHILPIRITARDSGGISFYASDNTTQIALLDESGNLFIKGSIGSL